LSNYSNKVINQSATLQFAKKKKRANKGRLTTENLFNNFLSFFQRIQLNVAKLLDKREKLDFFVDSNASHKVISSKTTKTEVSKQVGTEHRGLGSSAPEIRAWIPPSLRPQHGLSEEAQRDEIFRKVSDTF
jgi:hypothetical protein